MSVALEFREISKRYGGFFQRAPVVALDGFSLVVNKGEIFGFLGPNGAGKTTAIHVALGLMLPNSGNGQLLGEPFGHPRTRRRVGFLAENVALYQRPAESLVRFYGQLNGVKDPVLACRTAELLTALDLKSVARRSVSKFSRGMLQRVGLAQAMVNDPELLILDEPTSALDPASRVVVRELLLLARREGKTIFLSSHLLSEIEMVCDRIGILHKGRLVKLGTTAELLRSNEEFEIVARQVGTADMGGEELAGGLVRFRVQAKDQRSAIESIWARRGEVVSVSARRKSLEEVFLSATSDTNSKEPLCSSKQDER